LPAIDGRGDHAPFDDFKRAGIAAHFIGFAQTKLPVAPMFRASRATFRFGSQQSLPARTARVIGRRPHLPSFQQLTFDPLAIGENLRDDPAVAVAARRKARSPPTCSSGCP
jgi:hypothetical protein